MLKNTFLLALILILAGCAGISFCDKDGRPKGCHSWDPATRNGGAPRS